MRYTRVILVLLLTALLLLAVPPVINNAGIIIIVTPISLAAETSVILEKDGDDVIVATVYIDRIYDPNDESDAIIPGGVDAYKAVVTVNPTGIEILDVRGVSPFDSPSFDLATGEFAVSGVASPSKPAHTPVAKIVLRLVGDALTPYDLTVQFQLIELVGIPGVNVPEESPNVLSFLRGDATKSGVTNIGDALFIAQYIVGQRSLPEINAVNAGSVVYDGVAGDKISIGDALFIAQYIVGQRNEFFE